ncbi:phosphate acyltransferase [Enterobacter hormaechei]|uniref:phosphate acyltransferase n=1 Tax=Enterobacter hormaechei TaxID=158836 RepID=UPI002FF4056E
MDDQLKQSALDFHEFPVPGKIQVSPTKPLATQRDLALAYSPGVAAPCLEIEKDPLAAYKYTARGNLVAVISNGTAVLGLGNIGALAGKPVMEGKGVLFKKFAGIDVFDIEVDELDPDKFINVVAALEPIFSQARADAKRVVLAEGEEARVLHATQELITLGMAKPILIGRPSVIEMRIQKLGLQIKPGVDFEIVNNESDPRFKEYWNEYYSIMKRRGITQEQAQRAVISNTTVIGAIMVHRGEADALICGTIGEYHEHFSVVQEIFGYREGVHTAGAMNALLLPSGNTFIADTYVNDDPSPEELAEITVMAAETVRRFGIEPKVALLSHSNFGSSKSAAACKMRQTLDLVRERAPELMIDGEMHGDAALVESIRNERMPDSPLKGSANVLIMPNVEAARISYNLLRVSSSEGVTVGPVLMGVSKPVHVLTPIASVRRIVNMVALAVVEAQTQPL